MGMTQEKNRVTAQRRSCAMDLLLPFLPLDEAIASKVVFAIVSGRTGGRTETLLEPAK